MNGPIAEHDSPPALAGGHSALQKLTLAIASGKGGTGKTTLAVNLAALLHAKGTDVRLLDCDVEEPNCRLFLADPDVDLRAVTQSKPVCDASRCTQCGSCVSACRFNALSPAKEGILVFDELCHACGVCFHVCPENALTPRDVVTGEVRISRAPFCLADGLLRVGQPSGGALIRAVRRHAAPAAVNIIDAAPGTACAVVEALHGVDRLLLVTEPTPFGLHDLKLAVDLAAELHLPVGVIINRSLGRDALVEDYCAEAGLPIIGRIPFSRKYAAVISEARILVDECPAARATFLEILDAITTVPFAVPHPSARRGEVQGATLDAPTRGVTGIAPPELVILSGKGGTGKTTVAAAFAALAENRTLADTDVDAPNLHLLLAPRIMSDEAFSGGGRAVLDARRCITNHENLLVAQRSSLVSDTAEASTARGGATGFPADDRSSVAVGTRCDGCGLCARECRFEAITMECSDDDLTVRVPIVHASACEGCGLCAIVCPTEALRLEPVETGRVFASTTDRGPMAHARLHAGAANSGKLATAVRRLAGSLAAAAASTEVLIDGPPGIGCPAIASLTGAARALLVTEPTVSGRHDLERLLALTRQFGVKPLLVINKEDLNPAQADAIRRFGAAHGVEYLGGIPFDETVYVALAEGKTVVENGNGPAAEAIRGIWRRLAGETTEGDNREMKIAIPVAGGRLCPHFGHCDEFCLIEADQEKKALGVKTMVTPPAHEPGLLPRWLHEQGVDLVIAGGMGQRAQNLFRQNGIEVVVGAPTGVPEQLAQAWLDGKLASGENVCDH